MSAVQTTVSILPSMLPQLQGAQVSALELDFSPADQAGERGLKMACCPAGYFSICRTACHDESPLITLQGSMPPISTAGKMSQLQGSQAQGHLPLDSSRPRCKPTLLLSPCPAGRLSRKGSTASAVPQLQGGQAAAAGAGPTSSAGPLPADQAGKPQVRTVLEGMEAVAHAAKTVSLRGDTERLQLWSSWVDQVT